MPLTVGVSEMPAQPTQCQHCDHLTATIEAAHERALVALTDPDARPFDGVVWLSAHLAAVEHVVTPLVDRYVDRDAADRRADRQVTRSMQRLLRALEQLAAADANAPRARADDLRVRLLSLLTQHAAGEHLLVEQLARVLGPERTAAVAERYEHAVQHGPTRPHPHQPRLRPLEPVIFAVDRLRDHVLDVLDARHVPIPVPRRQRSRTGKWGHYLLGSMHSDE